MNIGRFTFYPFDSAMRGALEFTLGRGYVVIFPPSRKPRRRSKAYWSPNATPWHHGMVPLWGCRVSLDCSCGKAECPRPKVTVEP